MSDERSELQKWWDKRARLLKAWTEAAHKVVAARKAYVTHLDTKPTEES